MEFITNFNGHSIGDTIETTKGQYKITQLLYDDKGVIYHLDCISTGLAPGLAAWIPTVVKFGTDITIDFESDITTYYPNYYDLSQIEKKIHLHNYKTYQGLTEVYDYCVDCNEKKTTLV